MKRAKTLLLACVLLCGSGAARADDYPSKSLRLIVPFAAGGAVGAVARVLSTPLSASLGQSIVIDNRGGAGGIIGMDAVAKSPPDGYTLLLVHSGLTYMPGLYRKLPFDPMRDFDGIVTAVSGSHALAVSAASPFKTVAELIAYAKANPGKLTYGSAGIGSTLHLAAEFFKRAAGVDILHVPYKGASQATTDLVGGQVQMMFGPLVAIMPLAEAGQIRALAVTSPRVGCPTRLGVLSAREQARGSPTATLLPQRPPRKTSGTRVRAGTPSARVGHTEIRSRGRARAARC